MTFGTWYRSLNLPSFSNGILQRLSQERIEEELRELNVRLKHNLLNYRNVSRQYHFPSLISQDYFFHPFSVFSSHSRSSLPSLRFTPRQFFKNFASSKDHFNEQTLEMGQRYNSSQEWKIEWNVTSNATHLLLAKYFYAWCNNV